MNATTVSSYWSERCSAAVNPPLPALLSRLAASSFSGIVFFAASAFLSFLILLVWLRAAANDRAKLWDHLSAFAGLTFAGSCIGIVMVYAFFSFESCAMSLFGDASLSAPSKRRSSQIMSIGRRLSMFQKPWSFGFKFLQNCWCFDASR